MHTLSLSRLAWPFGSLDLRLPARPGHRHDKPALLWRDLVRRSGRQPRHDLQALSLPRPC